MNLTEQLTETWTAIIDLLAGLDDRQWMSGTPCEGWTVHDVAAHLGHIEGSVQGFDQPESPPTFDPNAFAGLDAVTETGVAARRAWSHDRVLDEVRRSSGGTLDLVSGLDEEGWNQPYPSPIGMMPMHQTQDLRLADAYVHLMDIRDGLGMALDASTEPSTARTVVARAVRLTGWGAVKGAGLADGTRITFDLTGPGGTKADLVIEGGRGRLVDPGEPAEDRISGPGLAYLMAVAGRSSLVDACGGLEVRGGAAQRLLEGYRLFL